MQNYDLKNEVLKVRNVLEIIHKELDPPYFKNFPKGTCGDTSDLLAQWLIEKGFDNVKCVCGQKNGEPHAWLELNDLIIDITSDQFDDGLSPVYIGRNRDFHDTFNKQNSTEPIIPPYLTDAYKQFHRLMHL
ncbi:MAG: hypothetical protein GY760_27710 [Deltaproteobacteria bacterium]|nr:hypothetical protein [Deltaproteobacteria bacterium]